MVLVELQQRLLQLLVLCRQEVEALRHIALADACTTSIQARTSRYSTQCKAALTWRTRRLFGTMQEVSSLLAQSQHIVFHMNGT